MVLSKRYVLLLIFLVSLFAVPSASAQDRVGDLAIFISDAEESYPYAAKFNNIVDTDNFYDNTYDSFQFQDWEGNNYKAVNDGADSDDWEITRYDTGVCHLSIFDHDPATSETGKVVFTEGTHIEYNGNWPDLNSGDVFDYWFDDGNNPLGEKTARNIYENLRDTGFNGQDPDGQDGTFEMIRGPSDWRLDGDILCTDHTGGDDLEWRMCTDSEDDGTQVTANGQNYVCDASESSWVQNDPPNAFFTIDDSNNDGVYSIGEELTFEADEEADHYRWDWDNDGNYEDENDFSSDITHTFESGTTQTIELEVEDEYGVTESLERTITLDDECIYGEAVNEYGGFNPVYWNYGYDADDFDFTLDHNGASCPDPSQMTFNVCDHSLGEEFIEKEDDQYSISFDIPQDVPCTWKRYNATGEDSGHKINLTMSDGTDIPHQEQSLYVSSKGDVANPHKGYYIYVEQNIHSDPNNFSGMWLTNQTWYDCDGSCGLTEYNRFPDNGTANSRNVPKGAKFMVEQEDENPDASDGDSSRHEAGVYHAEYGAIIENQSGNSINDYVSEPANSTEQENCGNSECWWLGDNYGNLTSVLNQGFGELTEDFTDAAVIY